MYARASFQVRSFSPAVGEAALVGDDMPVGARIRPRRAPGSSTRAEAPSAPTRAMCCRAALPAAPVRDLMGASAPNLKMGPPRNARRGSGCAIRGRRDPPDGAK
jgi:hypothetical protein